MTGSNFTNEYTRVGCQAKHMSLTRLVLKNIYKLESCVRYRVAVVGVLPEPRGFFMFHKIIKGTQATLWIKFGMGA